MVTSFGVFEFLRDLSTTNQPPPGPPYAPTTAAIGGLPTVTIDVPITSVFLVLFLCGATWHMTTFRLNRKKGHKFLPSLFLFYLSFIRTVTCTMRIVLAKNPSNTRVAIAASVLVTAGVLILFIVNLVFVQRIVRALHPRFGWHGSVSRGWIAIYACVPLLLIMAITTLVISLYELDGNTLRICHDLQLFAATFLAVLSFLPAPIVLVCFIFPRGCNATNFGSSTMATKVVIIVFSATILAFGAAFRAGTAYVPRPASDPAWYHSKVCFYVFNFFIEIVVIYLYALVRVDKIFYIPDKINLERHTPGAYGYIPEKK